MDVMPFLLHVALFLLGVVIVITVLMSAIRTFVLPRSAQDQITRTVFLSTRKLFNLRVSRATTYEDRDRIMALYAPVSLLLLPAAWLTGIGIGYTCMYRALGIVGWQNAFSASGQLLFTLGLTSDATLITTILGFSEAAIGLILVALLIAYLPTMYAAFSKRETSVTMLEVRAGSPPSAVEMFQRYYRLNRMELLNDEWLKWEIWFVELEETHTSLGALTFFRSPQGHRSWITAAGTVLDSAALYASTLDVPPNAQAQLCIRAGFIALRHIADFFRIQHNANPKPDDPISVTRADFDDAYDRLAASGIPLKPDRDLAWQNYAGWRVNYDTVLLALAAVTMAPYAPWVSDRSLRRPAHKKAKLAHLQADGSAAVGTAKVK